jgi:hypothetical protein
MVVVVHLYYDDQVAPMAISTLPLKAVQVVEKASW